MMCQSLALDHARVGKRVRVQVIQIFRPRLAVSFGHPDSADLDLLLDPRNDLVECLQTSVVVASKPRQSLRFLDVGHPLCTS